MAIMVVLSTPLFKAGHMILLSIDCLLFRETVSSWMYSIAHNVFIDNVRKQKGITYSNDLTKWDVQDEVDLDENILKDEQKEILENAIKQLNPEQRETLVLSRYHELKYREIAEIFNVTESTIKVRIFRAMKNLKKIYARMEN